MTVTGRLKVSEVVVWTGGAAGGGSGAGERVVSMRAGTPASPARAVTQIPP